MGYLVEIGRLFPLCIHAFQSFSEVNFSGAAPQPSRCYRTAKQSYRLFALGRTSDCHRSIFTGLTTDSSSKQIFTLQRIYTSNRSLMKIFAPTQKMFEQNDISNAHFLRAEDTVPDSDSDPKTSSRRAAIPCWLAASWAKRAT